MSEKTGNRWSQIGVGGGGAMFLPTVSPHDPATVVVSCDMTGCYITCDAGDSWRMFNLRGKALDICFDTADERVIYVAAGSAGLWRSADSGTSWDLVFPDRETVDRVVYPDDHAGTQYVLAGGGHADPVTAVETGADGLYAAAGGTILRSGDADESWLQIATITGESVVGLHRDPYHSVLYAVTDAAVYRIGEGELDRRPAPGHSRVAHALGFAGERSYFYWASADRLFVSTNYGLTWVESRLGEPGYALHSLAVSASDPEIAYLSYSDLKVGDAAYFGIARTVDGGAQWTLVRADRADDQDRTDDTWVDETPARSEWAWGIGVGPHDPDLCFTTDWGSVWRTTNGGLRWRQRYFRRVTEKSITTTGLGVTTNYGVFLDPFDDRRWFICYTDVGLIRSEDGGRSWMPTQDGIPRRWHNTTYWMEFDPEVEGTVWAVMAANHDLPRPKMWRGQSTSSFDGGVCVSRDGGRTWQVCCDGLPPTAPTHIVLDPASPAGPRTLYISTMGRGVFKSVDDGRSWLAANDGIAESEPLAWRLNLAGNALYLIVFRRSEEPDGAGALYRSYDAAGHWDRVPLPDGVTGPAGILVDRDDPERIYLAAWRRDTVADRDGGGILRSTDGGASWETVLDRDQHIYDITAHPTNAEMLFACGFESNAWISRDRGDTWDRIAGYNFKWGHRVVVDPTDPEMIYVTTFGGGVWHGPITGDPGALEDIRTAGLRYQDQA